MEKAFSAVWKKRLFYANQVPVLARHCNPTAHGYDRIGF